jgi:hypothetical protein
MHQEKSGNPARGLGGQSRFPEYFPFSVIFMLMIFIFRYLFTTKLMLILGITTFIHVRESDEVQKSSVNKINN